MTSINFLPRTLNITGASATGSSGTVNRTYTISDTDIMSAGFDLIVNGTTLHEGSGKDFTRSGSVVTFLNKLWDASIIRINYFILSPSATATTTLKYATPLQFAQILGIVNDIPSWENSTSPTRENVGTGDDSTTIFYLDQKSVISDTYTLTHGTSEASLTTLTETTHYTIDNDTSTITLTSAGVTEVGTDNIYATYKYYSNGMKDSYIISVLSRAEKEVENTTNTFYTDATQTNPTYPLETEIQPSPGYFRDQIIVNKRPLVDVETTLDGAHDASTTTISLASGTGDNYRSSGYIIINSEVISYTGVSTDDLTGCVRGALGTTAAAHSDGDAVHSTILFLSNTAEGTAVTFTVQPWNTKMHATEEGLLFSFADSVFVSSQYPDRLTKQDIANRVKIIYLYGYNTIPADITRLTLLFGKRALMQDSIGSSIIKGRNEFRPEMFNADENEMQTIINSYIILPMKNT